MLNRHIQNRLTNIVRVSIVGKVCTGTVLGILFCTAAMTLTGASTAHAQQQRTVPSQGAQQAGTTRKIARCPGGSRTYRVLQKDASGDVSSHFSTPLLKLVPFNPTLTPDVNISQPVVCIAVAHKGGSHLASRTISAPSHKQPTGQGTSGSQGNTGSGHGTTPPPPSPGGGPIVSMINQVFGANAPAAIAVARCESGLNPNATNPSSGAAGLFQFLPSTWRTTSEAGASPYNAYANIVAAHQVFVRDGYSWREWSCKP